MGIARTSSMAADAGELVGRAPGLQERAVSGPDGGSVDRPPSRLSAAALGAALGTSGGPRRTLAEILGALRWEYAGVRPVNHTLTEEKPDPNSSDPTDTIDVPVSHTHCWDGSVITSGSCPPRPPDPKPDPPKPEPPKPVPTPDPTPDPGNGCDPGWSSWREVRRTSCSNGQQTVFEVRTYTDDDCSTRDQSRKRTVTCPTGPVTVTVSWRTYRTGDCVNGQRTLYQEQLYSDGSRKTRTKTEACPTTPGPTPGPNPAPDPDKPEPAPVPVAGGFTAGPWREVRRTSCVNGQQTIFYVRTLTDDDDGTKTEQSRKETVSCPTEPAPVTVTVSWRTYRTGDCVNGQEALYQEQLYSDGSRKTRTRYRPCSITWGRWRTVVRGDCQADGTRRVRQVRTSSDGRTEYQWSTESCPPPVPVPPPRVDSDGDGIPDDEDPDPYQQAGAPVTKQPPPPAFDVPLDVPPAPGEKWAETHRGPCINGQQLVTFRSNLGGLRNRWQGCPEPVSPRDSAQESDSRIEASLQEPPMTRQALIWTPPAQPAAAGLGTSLETLWTPGAGHPDDYDDALYHPGAASLYRQGASGGGPVA
ncbi:MAG: hypothetical protein F4213_08145, partial [Boseongicola sp. SB0677_bin_26]|nr:hypothetical protein [Boseongicola sp. SB0677_bin_26]